MMLPELDILVVGAGPAGCLAAERLADRGRSVALVDENDGPREAVVCSGIVSTEAFGRFDLPRSAIVDTVRAARFVSPSGIDLTYAPRDPLAHVVSRTVLDGALADRAERAGAVLLRGHAARGVRIGRRGVELEARVDGGEERTLRARALVVATGSQRWLHEDAGLGVPTRYVQGIHAEAEFEALEEAEVYFGNDLTPGWFAWAVPFGAKARLGLLAPQGGRALFRRFVGDARIRSRLGGSGGDGARAGRSDGAGSPTGPEPPDRDGDFPGHLQSRAIVQGAVKPSFADRVLAVGEAAGQVKTTTGGGIYFGLIGAELAAGTLDAALGDDRLGAERLSAYERAWRDEIGGEIRTGLELQRAGRRMGDRQIDALFHALNDGLGAVARRLVTFDWHRPVLQRIFTDRRFTRLVAGGIL